MPTNRTPINRYKFRITPQIVDLYRRAREIYDDGDAVDHWAEAGGRRGEFYDIDHQLHLLLGCPPWEEDIFDTIDEDTPPQWLDRERKKSWQTAYAIRVELDRLLRAAAAALPRSSSCPARTRPTRFR